MKNLSGRCTFSRIYYIPRVFSSGWSVNVHWFGGNDSLFGCWDKRCRISEAYSHLHSALFLRTTKIIYQYLVRETRREIVMQDARGTFQSESFYKMITFLLSLNERYLRTCPMHLRTWRLFHNSKTHFCK